MKGSLLARVRRVLTGHSERALVDAVDDTGLEVKLEVPAEGVRDVVVGQAYVLTLAWSLHPVPRVPELVPGRPLAPSPSPPTVPPPAAASEGSTQPSVDEQFMALMARGRRPAEPEPGPPAAAAPPSATPPAPSTPLRPEQQLAARLGLGRPPS